jgi:hypothetical protein
MGRGLLILSADAQLVSVEGNPAGLLDDTSPCRKGVLFPGG